MDRRIIILSIVFLIQLQSMAFAIIYQRRHHRVGWRHSRLTMSYCAFLAVAIINEMEDNNEQRIWTLPREKGWWERIVLTEFRDREWITHFRMSKRTFLLICQSLAGHLQPDFNPLSTREPISPEKQIAITLMYLASCCEYRIVGELFGVGKTSVWRCVHRVVDAINEILLPEWIRMPGENECREISTAFEEKSKIPQLIGCIDGTHIPMTPPSDGYRDYVNRKGWTSIVLQAVVDNNKLFRNVNCQSPGSSHDAAIFRDSDLYRNYENIIPQETRLVNGTEVPYMIVGDPAYPLLPWLLKGDTRARGQAVSPEQDSFNVYLNKARVAVEIAFGRLKARWRVLLKRIELHHTFAPFVVSACCVLHNILENEGEPIPADGMFQVNRGNQAYPQPIPVGRQQYVNYNADLLRDSLKDYLTQFPLLRSFRAMA